MLQDAAGLGADTTVQDDARRAVESFKWVFKQKQVSADQFIVTVGQLLELVRKFLLEGNLTLVKVAIKEYVQKWVHPNPLAKQIVESGCLLKNFQDATIDLQRIAQKTGVKVEGLQCLVIHLRELERVEQFLEVRARYQDFYRANEVQSKMKTAPLQPERLADELSSLEKRCLDLLARNVGRLDLSKQPQVGREHQVLFFDCSDVQPGALDYCHIAGMAAHLQPLRATQLYKISQTYGFQLLRVLHEVTSKKEKLGLASKLTSSCILSSADAYVQQLLTKSFSGDSLQISSILRPEDKKSVLEWQVESMLLQRDIMLQVFSAGEQLRPADGIDDPLWQCVFDDADIIV